MDMRPSVRSTVIGLLVLSLVAARASWAAERSFPAGSLIIPMDLAYQDRGLFQAYGLVFALLNQGVKVYWVIDPNKTWHAADCDTAGDLCGWDCAEEGSGTKCPYPTASPDFYAGADVRWQQGGRAPDGTTITRHGYRGGPFVVDAAETATALPIVDAWNDQTQWADHPWAQRTVFEVVAVHEAAEAFTGDVRKEMVAAPTIAVFSDGNEDIATGYLRAAGIPQSNGSEFPAGKCGAANCGPGTANPDMLTVPAVMGDMGTCTSPNTDHKNGALFTVDGVPAYCQIMSMHWDVANDREAVKCNGGDCPATAAECTGQTITYHGHEVVAEVRQFLQYPVHFFAECQAVNAYENTVPNPAWPWLDDTGREGHFLTTTGNPPSCSNPGGACSDADYVCVENWCDNGMRTCCQPKDVKEKGAGYLIATQPQSATIKILRPDIPYNQLDGAFGTVGGSEPAYNLSAYLGTGYKNDREVVFITGPNGPGEQDLWMTGYVDGTCNIGDPDTPGSGTCGIGKVSYLGGHKYDTVVPVSGSAASQGTRLFLNALFEADCVTSVGQPQLSLGLTGAAGGPAVPVSGDFVASFTNSGPGPALEGYLRLALPAGVAATAADGNGVIAAGSVEWDVGSISGTVRQAGDPPAAGGRGVTLRFDDYGDYTIEVALDYRVGASSRRVGPVAVVVTVGHEVPADGGVGDGGAGGDGGGGGGDGTSDCGCAAGGASAPGLALLALAGALAARPRRRR
jgi:MYXO-CTERM domain-containing protein